MFVSPVANMPDAHDELLRVEEIRDCLEVLGVDINPIGAALDERPVLRRFLQSTLLQHFREPCELQTRWQVSSPSSRRPTLHGGSSQDSPLILAQDP
jgi:hypothetical protein